MITELKTEKMKKYNEALDSINNIKNFNIDNKITSSILFDIVNIKNFINKYPEYTDIKNEYNALENKIENIEHIKSIKNGNKAEYAENHLNHKNHVGRNWGIGFIMFSIFILLIRVSVYLIAYK